MFDINSRMEQWSAANRAQHTEEISKALETPAQPVQTEHVTKSASVKERAKPFMKSEGPHFSINDRMDSWNATERAGDKATFESLKRSTPFRKAEEMSQIVEELMQESPEALIELAEELTEELESRQAGSQPKAPEDSPAEAPKEEKKDEEPEEEKDDSDKSDDEEDKKDENPFA